DREVFARAYQAHTQELQKAVLGAAVQSYDNLKPELKRLADKTKIVGVLGNHDLALGYKLLSDIIDFAELKPEVRVKGRTGTEFVVKGTINSFEVPGIYTHPLVQQLLAPAFINYLAGHSSDKVPEAREANEKELARLEQTGAADIFLLHKAPGSFMGDGGEHAVEYSKNVGSMYGGHGHRGEILVKDGKPIFRPGSNHIFVYDYDSDKKIETVRIYRIRDIADEAN
ncbi:MAG: hypothetical protein KJ574_02635, partial [Nanoarchaeota archaeon]|nr:hypothetical protein [Nanoarchaeota archaeon]